MVFPIRNTQNRHSEAIQVKLDELLELDRIRAGYTRLAGRAREELRQGRADVGSPEVE